MRWYPLLLLLYAGGVAAIAVGKYDGLAALLHAEVADSTHSRGPRPLVRAVVDALSDFGRRFKELPGRERNHTPRSEHLLKLLQPTLDDLLFVGRDYESYFDRFEAFLALEHAHLFESEGEAFWGPRGRFAYMYCRGQQGSPLHHVLAEAKAKGESWPPLAAGFFAGSSDRFKEVAEEFARRVGRLGFS